MTAQANHRHSTARMSVKMRFAFNLPLAVVITLLAPDWWACATVAAANLLGYVEGRFVGSWTTVRVVPAPEPWQVLASARSVADLGCQCEARPNEYRGRDGYWHCFNCDGRVEALDV